MSARTEISIILSAVDRASGALREVADATDSLADRFSSLKDIAKVAAGVVLGELAHDALGALTSSLSDASGAFIDYESTLVRITAAMGLTGEEAAKMREELAKVAESQTDLGFTAVEAAEALESLVKAGLEGEDAAKALRSALEMARLEGISTEQAANLLVATLNQFGLSAEDAGRALDVLVNASALGIDAASDFATGLSYVGTIASMMGLSLEETTAALVAMNNAGINAASAGRYLASMLTDLINKGKGVTPTFETIDRALREGTIDYDRLRDAIADVIPELAGLKEEVGETDMLFEAFLEMVQRGEVTTEQYAEILKKCGFEVNQLGFSIYNADGSMKSLNEIVQLLNARLSGFATQAERDAYLTEIFGEQGRRAAAVLVQMSGEFGTLTAKIGESGTATQMVNEILNTTAGRLAQAHAESVNASMGFGQLTAGVQQAFTQFTAFLGPLGGVVNNLGPSMLQGAIAGVTTALPSLIGNVGALTNAFGAMGGLISGTIIPLLTNPLTLAIGGVALAAVGLYMAWENNWLGIRDLTNNVVGALQTSLGGFVNWLTSGWSSLVNALRSAWSGFTSGVSRAFSRFAGWFKDNWTVVFGPAGVIYTAWRNNWLGIRDVFMNVWASIQNAVINGVKTIQDALGGLWRGFQDTLSGIQNATGSALKSIQDAFAGAGNAIVSGAQGLYNALVGGSIWTDMFRRMIDVAEKSFEEIGRIADRGMGRFSAEVAAEPPMGGNIVTVTGPLVTVYGSVNEERLARLIQEKLRNVLIESTSSAAPTKRIRIAGVG